MTYPTCSIVNDGDAPLAKLAAEFEPRLLRAFNLFVHGAAAFAAVVGVLVLSGWHFDQPLLKSLNPAWVAMNPLTALTFAYCGAWLWIRRRWTLSGWQNLLFGVVPVAVGLGKLAILVGIDLAWDQAFYTDKLIMTTGPNRMAPNTAVCFSLLGLAMTTATLGNKKLYLFSQGAALASIVVALLAFTGYAYGVVSMMQISLYIPMAFHTAVLFLTLSIAVLAIDPTGACGLWRADCASVFPHTVGARPGTRMDLVERRDARILWTGICSGDHGRVDDLYFDLADMAQRHGVEQARSGSAGTKSSYAGQPGAA